MANNNNGSYVNIFTPIEDLESVNFSIDTSQIIQWENGITALSADNLNQYSGFIKELPDGVDGMFTEYTRRINANFTSLNDYLGKENSRLTNLLGRFNEYDSTGFPANEAESYAVIVYRTGSSSSNTGTEGNGLFIINANENLNGVNNVDMIGYEEIDENN